jgi:hypothetical protein
MSELHIIAGFGRTRALSDGNKLLRHQLLLAGELKAGRLVVVIGRRAPRPCQDHGETLGE